MNTSPAPIPAARGLTGTATFLRRSVLLVGLVGGFITTPGTTNAEDTLSESGPLVALEAYLKAGNAESEDYFGYSVAMSGDTAVIGAFGEDSSATDSGAAYVFVRSGGTWTQQAYLKADNAGEDDFFGYSVAVSGDTVVIGARDEDSNATTVNGDGTNNSATDSGAAYVFVRTGGTWTQQAYLKADNCGAGDWFGLSVAVSGDTAVIGASGESSNATSVGGNGTNNSAHLSGAAYVFVRSGSSWTQQAYLKASNSGVSDSFGRSVAVAGDTAVIGAYGEASIATASSGVGANDFAFASGAAYVFTRSGSTWTQQADLKASNSEAGDFFGYSVAVSGDTVVIGAPFESSNATTVGGDGTNNSAGRSGAAYVFHRRGSTWTQQVYLKADNSGADDWFGWSVAVAGDIAVIGAYGEDSNATSVDGNGTDNSAVKAGAAYTFSGLGLGTPTPNVTLVTPDGGSTAGGTEVTITGTGFTGATSVTFDGLEATMIAITDTSITVITPPHAAGPVSVLITTPAGTDPGNTFYTYSAAGPLAALEAYFKAGNSGARDKFGYSVAVSGDTAVIGARDEDSNATSVGGDGTDNSADNSGAAYVFVRSGSTWTQQAYLKADNSGANDAFGTSVAVSGDTVVIGAPYEDSQATTVNGDGTDNSASASGAAYVFTRSGSTWTQQAYLKADNAGASDWFGISVAVSGDTIVIGANLEGSNANSVGGDGMDNSADYAGAAYVFVRSGITWTQQAYLKAGNAEADEWFGESVAVSGDTAVIGALREDSNATGVNGDGADNSASSAGAAYVFVRSGSTWTQQAYLKADNAGAGDNFGTSVAVSGDTVVIGASGEGSNATGVGGDGSDNSASASGAAYVFTRSGSTWTQQAYLKAGNAGASDFFGISVAVSGDTAVIGAYGEDSNATGVGGNGTNNSAFFAGAAYVFTRRGDLWTQQAYLKASNSEADDFFGWSVAVSGDTAVIGANNEDSNAKTVGGNDVNNSATDSGAAYVFTGLGPEAPLIAVTGNGVNIPQDDTTPSALDFTDFGDVALLNTQVSRAFALVNEGNLPLQLTGTSLVTLGGPGMASFKVIRDPDAAVGAGESSPFIISFDPTLPGPQTATVTITSDAGNHPDFSFAITGFGLPSKPLAQTISFAPPTTVYPDQGPLSLAAAASSGLPVTLSVVPAGTTAPGVGIVGNVLSFTGAGKVTVQAVQAGDGSYAAARTVVKTITVKAAPAALTLVDLAQTYTGTPRAIRTLGGSGEVTIEYKIGSAFGSTAPTAAGKYSVKATDDSGTKTGTLTINKAPLYVTPDDKRKFAGEENPVLTASYSGFLASDAVDNITQPVLKTTAKATSGGGLYPITASGGAAANYLFVYQQGTMVVESFGGSYEALLVDVTDVPVAKLTLTVPLTGQSFSGKLATAKETAALSLKGSLTTDVGEELATGTATVVKSGVSYDVSFTLPMQGDVLVTVTRDDQPLGFAETGRKLLALAKGSTVPYSGAHTAVLEPVLPAMEGFPAGAGWATATLSKTGVMTLAGRLADGTAFTTAVAPDGDADPGYRLFVQPYKKRVESYLSGGFTLLPHPTQANRRYVEEAGLSWSKEGRDADASYRRGFGPLTTVMMLDPWLPPVAAKGSTPGITLATRLGLTGSSFGVQHSDTGSTLNGDLPTRVGLSVKNEVSVQLPVSTPVNATKWKTKLVPATGLFSGSFELADTGAKPRVVTFSGVLRQPATAPDDLIGDGHYLLPALPDALSNERLSGEVMFTRP